MEENMPGGSSLKIYEYLAKVRDDCLNNNNKNLLNSYFVNKNHQLLERNLMRKMIG
jgi:hypothetical protein